jgi:hypothetical protein
VTCAAVQIVADCTQGPAELTCDLWEGHRPPIHLNHELGIHWFRIEEQPGYEPGTSLDYEPSGG